MSSAAVITNVAIASAIVLYALKKMVSHRLRAMTYRNHVASFSAATLQEQVAVDVPDAVISDDNSSQSVMQTCCPLLPPSREPWKPTLVLDLDETLVRAVPAVKPMFPAELLKVSQDDGDFFLWLALRPFVHQFLSSLAAHYELVVWTAGTEPYGRAVVQRLDPSGSFISRSLYRQHCTQQDGRFIKDLDRLARENVRICDNNPVSYSFQPTKGIPVNDFLGDPQDMELVKLLRELKPTDDVEMLDVEHIPFSGRRVHFGFVHVKVYDPNEAPCVEDVDMLDVEHIPFSGRRVQFGFVHVKVYDPNEAPHAEDAEMIDADSFGLEEPSSEPEEMVKEDTVLKMLNELDPVGLDVCNGRFVLPCVTNNTAISTVFEEQEQAVPQAEESVDVTDTAPKRPRRSRVSNGGPLRRSARLARKYPRRSARLVAKRLAAKP